MNWNNFIVGLVLFSVVTIAAAVPVLELTDNYNIDDEGQFNNTLNKLTAITNITGDQTETLQEGTIDEADFFTTFTRNAYSGIKLFFGFPIVVYSLLLELTEIIGFPTWILQAGIIIITISLLFVILLYLMKAKGEDN